MLLGWSKAYAFLCLFCIIKVAEVYDDIFYVCINMVIVFFIIFI